MTIFIMALIVFSWGIAAYFLLLMADARRLRAKLLDGRPAFSPEAKEETASPLESEYAPWVAPTPQPPAQAG
jgi:hypothetical protein